MNRPKLMKVQLALNQRELWGIAKRVSKCHTWVQSDHRMMTREREREAPFLGVWNVCISSQMSKTLKEG